MMIIILIIIIINNTRLFILRGLVQFEGLQLPGYNCFIV